ncbi:Fibronectin type III,Immunoglobulin subtype,Immunoglobulin-like domain,Immunoglobulin-like [Cinara cedri]|uniref:Fibronectin type III,Immunoglobulin subtype,Immunoglobulin-like domain,Immunoglobulin-like n=1 Tax=Cinara cedri TaxID=506608 RepID=A0A5E4MQY1_9HEMI|nr:Fibronectin type III,Immunoglobulin subtype,Immunoglobulin-like domain,Immunoglobulin-like [Cinara cedri]
MTAYLPCNMTPPTAGDRVTLVIWVKQGQTTPIYSYDIRRSSPTTPATVPRSSVEHKPVDGGAHWFDNRTLDGRAHFRVDSQPAALIMKKVIDKDAAVYKCRVDFKKSPTRNSKVNLTVILPPERLSVLNEKGDHIPFYVLGPYREGVTVDIACIASGGRPPPKVTWWQENALIDETYEMLPDRKVKNVLRLEHLERRHLNTMFTCQASNNHMVPPISSAVTLDMILRPLSINLVGENRPLSANKPVNISCRVIGAKPSPIISWWKDATQMTDVKQVTNSDDNVTMSVMTFTPTIKDMDKTLSCRAENGKSETVNNKQVKPDRPQPVTFDSSNGWKINIFHTPIVNLELGSKINSSAIQEGMDVYFECNIKSNPWVYRVTWKHNGKLLNHNVPAGTIVSNQSLVLQKVSRNRAGIYTCVGSNQEGDGESNSVFLDVKFAPVCRPGQETTQGVGRREAAKVVCEVEANPSDNVTYTWRFNNSRETVNLDRDRYTEEGSHSTAAYTPLTPLDYGTLMCWASNEFGKQAEPCVYQVIAAGRPDSLENCSVVNQTSASLMVRCQPGFDGGLSQRFVMEVYVRHGQSLAGNVTANRPSFTVGDLPSGLGFDISVYAYNIRGTSDPIQLHAYTLKSAEKRTAITPSGFRFSPMVGVIVVGCVASVVSIACIVVVAVIVQRKRSRRRRRRELPNGESKTAIDGGTGTGTRGDGGDGTADGGGSVDVGAAVGGGGGGGGGSGVDTVGVCDGDRHHHRVDAVDDGLERNPDIIPHDNDYLDEDEKAFERLNSGRMYTSRTVDGETCKQQARGLMAHPSQQQPLYTTDVVGSPAAGVAYPNLVCPTPPPPPSAAQLLLHHHYQQPYRQQQQQQAMSLMHHRHNGGGPPHSMQYVQVDHQHHYVPPPHHHQHYQPPPPPQVRTMTLGRYHNHNSHQDRSAEIPLLLAGQPTLQKLHHPHHQLHQRESTNEYYGQRAHELQNQPNTLHHPQDQPQYLVQPHQCQKQQQQHRMHMKSESPSSSSALSGVQVPAAQNVPQNATATSRF